MNAIRLLIADDHCIVREGLKQLFALVTNIVVAGEAADGQAAIDRLEQGGIDLLLLDMTMPGLNGDNLIARIRARHPGLPILVLSMHNEPQIAQRALKAGANGYLTKDQDPETLLGAVRRVAAGNRFLDPEIAERIAFDLADTDGQITHASLTGRELQIMRLLAGGHGVNDIGTRLTISSKTVSTHKARLMQKMGFVSNADLVKYAVAHGLAE